MDHIGELADRLRSPSAPLRVVSGVAVAVPDASHVLVSVGDRAVTAWSPGSVSVGDDVRLLVGGNVCEIVSSRGQFSQWTAPTLAGGWVNFGPGVTPAGFRRVGDVVELRGAIMSGTLDVAVFVLPEPLRSSAGDSQFVVVAGPGVARLDVTWSGQVIVRSYAAGGTSAMVSLAGVRFSLLT